MKVAVINTDEVHHCAVYLDASDLATFEESYEDGKVWAAFTGPTGNNGLFYENLDVKEFRTVTSDMSFLNRYWPANVIIKSLRHYDPSL